MILPGDLTMKIRLQSKFFMEKCPFPRVENLIMKESFELAIVTQMC